MISLKCFKHIFFFSSPGEQTTVIHYGKIMDVRVKYLFLKFQLKESKSIHLFLLFDNDEDSSYDFLYEMIKSIICEHS